MKGNRVYLAGPMRGYPEYNFPAFDAYQRGLEAKGYVVISPANLDRENGFEPGHPLTPELVRAMIMRDCEAICGVDMVVLMPGWEASTGVAVESALAKFLKLPVVELRNME